MVTCQLITATYDSKFKIQDSRFKIQDSKLKIKHLSCIYVEVISTKKLSKNKVSSILNIKP
jgi:hypothetical protein